MTSLILDRRGLSPGAGVAPATRGEDAGKAAGPGSRPVLLEEAAEGPDEALVLDARGALTPSRMVDEKLAALLQTGRARLGEAGRALGGRRAPGLEAEAEA